MRTNIVIDDQLMADVMASGAFKTKREAVEEGLRLLQRRKVYEGLLALRGKLQWEDADPAWAAAAAGAGERGPGACDATRTTGTTKGASPKARRRSPRA